MNKRQIFNRRHKTNSLLASLILAVFLMPSNSGRAAAEKSDVQTEKQTASWTVPRTSWGDPDLQGKWPLESLKGTPFQRPEEYGERTVLTDEEFAVRVKIQTDRLNAYDREDKDDRLGNGHWLEWGGKPIRQTSLIVEPTNGRIPPLTEKGLALATNMKSSWSEEIFEYITDFNPLDRCITRGLPASMQPFPYNNGFEIYQAPGYVVLNMELIHETRIIPVDGRPPLHQTIKPWLGDSVGHWEGVTLVIETTNFNGHSPMVIVGPRNKPIPTSSSMHIVERLTLTGPDTIQYEAWVEDPIILTGPWKMSFPLTRDESYEIFEYACHEGNTVVDAYIRNTNPRFLGTTKEK